jgi:SAM-dependent methyltransferase
LAPGETIGKTANKCVSDNAGVACACSDGRTDGTRTLNIHPDIALDFRALPFQDEAFKLVVFDPPHLVRAWPRSWLVAKYGKLGENWQDDLRRGFSECFRVLAPDGVLIFKWSEHQISKRAAIACAPYPPLFGHPTGRSGKTHWCVFMRPTEAA